MKHTEVPAIIALHSPDKSFLLDAGTNDSRATSNRSSSALQMMAVASAYLFFKVRRVSKAIQLFWIRANFRGYRAEHHCEPLPHGSSIWRPMPELKYRTPSRHRRQPEPSPPVPFKFLGFKYVNSIIRPCFTSIGTRFKPDDDF
ncbi:hypothetical protein BV22DRAFT_680034 [Leucogyrophana mollusca]|uniref:Uncharacterized protein n=1 Tax=Leucogyrophana mollusca TaxID=85980 RepID=A0ACB8B8I7_9AGAM|nr:hypothetical protein BV22DRAFT_680034 [Leucogyrophana mollusca]